MLSGLLCDREEGDEQVLSDFLTRKIIRETKTEAGKKLYTVSRLRSEVRSLIKEANKVLYDLDESKKSQYLRQYAADIESNLVRSGKSREGFVQMDVKFMKSKQLMTVYNALTALVQADKESVEYARKLADRKDTMRQKMAETMGKEISASEYETLYTMWQKYSDITDDYEYRELLDYIQKTNKKPGQIVDDIKRAEDRLVQLGVLHTDEEGNIIEDNRGIVLKYLTNEGPLESAMSQMVERGFNGTGRQLYNKANEVIGRRKR